MFYKNSSDENCIPNISKSLFKYMTKNEIILASINETGQAEGISKGTIDDIHTHLQSTNIWKKKTEWVTEVEYNIPHPKGDITAFDTNSGGDAKLSRRKTIADFKAVCLEDDKIYVRFVKTNDTPSDGMDFNTTRFSSVRIMNTKKFFYETDRSSWVFKLVVSWYGNTKSDAESSPKKYFAYIETNGDVKAASNPEYTSASFLEKIIDLISLGGKRKTLSFQDSTTESTSTMSPVT